VVGLAPFNIGNCPRGFVYLNDQVRASLCLSVSLSLSVSLRLRLPASIYGVGLMVEGEAVGQGGLVFARLPSSLSYGMAAWPVRKVPLRRTPIKVAYQPDMRVYIVVRRLVA
jgi:hypothetical protein